MYTINDDIKAGKLRNVYLLCGAEHYLVVSYRQKLLRAFCNTSDRSALCEDMNFTAFKGAGVLTEEIIGVAETLPFFADRRVILVEDTGLFAKEGDGLAEYLTKLSPTTAIIFVEENPDKRSRLYKAVEKYGHVADCKTQTEETLKRWVVTRVGNEGKKVCCK